VWTFFHYPITQRIQSLAFVPLLLLRLYLAPVMAQAGWTKWQSFDSTVEWFGNSDWGLGLPLPGVFAVLAITAELGGAALLLVGLFTRLAALALSVTMVVAAASVHLAQGWLAVADPQSWLANGVLWYDERVIQSAEKLAAIKALVAEHGDTDWLYSSGSLVILNNGAEFAVTYLLMLLVLLTQGSGDYLSLDYWLKRRSA